MANAVTFGYAEAQLMEPLVVWLRSRRQVRDGALLVEEFPWYGRRVDLAVLTPSKIATAYELKLAHNRRAIEQSYLNGAAFDRSYLVTATRPSPVNRAQAEALGVGVIFVDLGVQKVSLVLPSRRADVSAAVRTRLRNAIVRRSERFV